ncbi:MAG TPA: hypothetical protein VFB93_09335 [Burkholderiales bacterium]|nr:hypothetical protein [Burkholderiales bacterium]
MKLIRILSVAVLLVPALPAQAAEDPSSTTLSHALTLVHMFVRMAAESDSSQVSLRAIDEVLSGRNAAANEAVAGLMKDVLADVSPENRATIAAIGRDLVGVARKNLLGTRPGETLFPDRSLDARKELTAMGLTYHDSKQFLDAVKRNDTIAAELFIAGRGVDLSATDFWGRDAVDFARRNNNERLAQLILKSRPATRSAQPAPKPLPYPS